MMNEKGYTVSVGPMDTAHEELLLINFDYSIREIKVDRLESILREEQVHRVMKVRGWTITPPPVVTPEVAAEKEIKEAALQLKLLKHRARLDHLFLLLQWMFQIRGMAGQLHRQGKDELNYTFLWERKVDAEEYDAENYARCRQLDIRMSDSTIPIWFKEASSEDTVDGKDWILSIRQDAAARKKDLLNFEQRLEESGLLPRLMDAPEPVRAWWKAVDAKNRPTV